MIIFKILIPLHYLKVVTMYSLNKYQNVVLGFLGAMLLAYGILDSGMAEVRAWKESYLSKSRLLPLWTVDALLS